MTTFDIAVVGLGGVGSQVLAEATRRGLKAVGIDRFVPPHRFGSSHGQTRVIRQAYFEHPDYVPLALASYDGWKRLESESCRRLLYRIGLVQAGPSTGHVICGVRSAAEQHRLPLDELAPSDRLRWPGLRIPAALDAVFERSAGYLLVDDCVAAALDVAKLRKATIVNHDSVDSWRRVGDHFQIKLAGGDPLHCSRMIFAVGPWSSDLVGKLNLRLQVIRKSVFWYAARGDASRLPVFLLEQPNGVFYGFPDLGRGIKLAEHSGGQQVADPTQVDHEIDARDSNRIATFARDCVPAAGDVVDHSVCLYTMSQDSHFVVDHWPGEMGIAFAAGLSGHGFKFAPVLGQALVDMVVDGGTDLPIQFLSMARFG